MCSDAVYTEKFTSACNLILNAILNCYCCFKLQGDYKMLEVLWQFFSAVFFVLIKLFINFFSLKKLQ
jgi:hypothetical protein